jgi:hypothetical protein
MAWSFVRDDQPRTDTARQVALALHDEARDLAAAAGFVRGIGPGAYTTSTALGCRTQMRSLRCSAGRPSRCLGTGWGSTRTAG